MTDPVGAPAELPHPTSLIPHRPPFLLVDRLVELEPAVRAVGEWDIDDRLGVLAGHFPGRPIVPGVLLCEALAQTAAASLLSDERFAGRLPLFGGLDRARFRRQVVPGDTVRLEVTVGRLSARGGRGSGRATVGDELACEADLLFVFA